MGGTGTSIGDPDPRRVLARHSNDIQIGTPHTSYAAAASSVPTAIGSGTNSNTSANLSSDSRTPVPPQEITEDEGDDVCMPLEPVSAALNEAASKNISRGLNDRCVCVHCSTVRVELFYLTAQK